jgi:hypothetical protein
VGFAETGRNESARGSDLGYRGAEIDVLDVDIHTIDRHPDHFLKGTRDFGLDRPPDLADVAVTTEHKVEIEAGASAFDRDPNPIPQAAAKQAVYASRDGRQAGDAGHG